MSGRLGFISLLELRIFFLVLLSTQLFYLLLKMLEKRHLVNVFGEILWDTKERNIFFLKWSFCPLQRGTCIAFYAVLYDC